MSADKCIHIYTYIYIYIYIYIQRERERVKKKCEDGQLLTLKNFFKFLTYFTSEVVHPRIFFATFVFAVRFGLRIFIDPPGAVHLYTYIHTCGAVSESITG